MNKLVLVTRKSALAKQQTAWVAQQLHKFFPSCAISTLEVSTEGDERLEVALNKIGGKGLFVKRLEESLLHDEADCAVHSLKDVPQALPDGLTLAAVCKREDPRDVFISRKHAHFRDLPKHARVGTSSLRRASQLLAHRPDLQIDFLRGNIFTRLRKLEEGLFDAIILAAAGLHRMQLQAHITHYFTLREMIPAIGQGALGLEIRSDDVACAQALQRLTDAHTWAATTAERALGHALGASCQVPIGAHAEIIGKQLSLTACVATPDGSTLLHAECAGSPKDAHNIGMQAAQQLLAQGAKNIIEALQ